jgi:hypothetical protein
MINMKDRKNERVREREGEKVSLCVLVGKQ